MFHPQAGGTCSAGGIPGPSCTVYRMFFGFPVLKNNHDHGFLGPNSIFLFFLICTHDGRNVHPRCIVYKQTAHTHNGDVFHQRNRFFRSGKKPAIAIIKCTSLQKQVENLHFPSLTHIQQAKSSKCMTGSRDANVLPERAPWVRNRYTRGICGF